MVLIASINADHGLNPVRSGKDTRMTRMFVRHMVNDYDTWRAAYDKFDATRRPMGVVNDGVYRSVDNKNDVTAFHDFTSLDDAQAFAKSDALREAMAGAGVASAPEIWFVEEV